jgi:hypothetical protein
MVWRLWPENLKLPMEGVKSLALTAGRDSSWFVQKGEADFYGVKVL